MRLRPYQEYAIRGLFDWWNQNGPEACVVVLPTASGKTIIFTTLIAALRDSGPVRVLVLAHTKELVDQAADKFATVRPDMVDDVGIYCAGLDRKETDKPITIASRDSFANALSKFEPFDLIIVDESHLVNTKDEGRYRKIINWNREGKPGSAVVGFTATPFRQGLSGGFIYGEDRLFKGVAYEAKMRELMNSRYIAKLTAKAVPLMATIDATGVKTTGNDFNQGELQSLATDRALVYAAILDWKSKAFDQGRRASCFFAVGVDHANMIKEGLDTFGITAKVITGETDSDVRAETIAEFDRGDLPALVNVACLTTGWDAPILDCIVAMRPTRSLALWLQIVGRGLRLFKGKENTLILDYGGNLERFGPIDEAQPRKNHDNAKKTSTCDNCNEIVSAFARHCHQCGHQLKPDPVKVCENCDTRCANSAKKCPACDQLFLGDDAKTVADPGSILSHEKDHRYHKIERVTATPIKSQRGKFYCRVTFWASLETKFNKNLMIGWYGNAGTLAVGFWRKLLPGVPLPENAGHGAKVINDHAKEILNRVVGVTVDHRSKYKDILELNENDPTNSETSPGSNEKPGAFGEL